MPRLTPDQIEALRAMPLGASPNRLRLAIALAGVTQVEVAEALGMATSNLSMIVRGKRYETITMATARKLADYFGAGIEDLFPAVRNEAAAS